VQSLSDKPLKNQLKLLGSCVARNFVTLHADHLRLVSAKRTGEYETLQGKTGREKKSMSLPKLEFKTEIRIWDSILIAKTKIRDRPVIHLSHKLAGVPSLFR